MSTGRNRQDRGSLTVELVVITPVLLVLAVAMLAFGRVSSSRQSVIEAARGAAEAAAVLPDASRAASVATAEAAVSTSDGDHLCASLQVVTDVNHFYPGGQVTVTVACQVELSDLALPGIPGSTTLRASSTAPIDPYRSVG